MSKIGLVSAYLDESVITSPERPGTYLMCAVVVADADSDMCRTSMMTCLLPGRSYLHHRDELPDRQVHIATEIARLPIIGIIIQHAELIAPTKQEAVRARILATLLPRLEHTEGAGAAVLESRG